MRINHHSAIAARCGLALLLAASLICRADTTNLTAVADASLHSFFPDSNFGGGDSFTSGGRNMGGHARALLRFDIAGRLPAGATINSAQLTLTVNNVNGPNSTFDLHRVLAGWGEVPATIEWVPRRRRGTRLGVIGWRQTRLGPARAAIILARPAAACRWRVWAIIFFPRPGWRRTCRCGWTTRPPISAGCCAARRKPPSAPSAVSRVVHRQRTRRNWWLITR